jgi:hypothetical protein
MTMCGLAVIGAVLAVTMSIFVLLFLVDVG